MFHDPTLHDPTGHDHRRPAGYVSARNLAFAEESDPAPRAPKISLDHVDFWYGETQALFDVSMDIAPNEITAFIGPSGCGKSTALKCLNRMHDEIRGARMTGRVLLDGDDVHAPDVDPPLLRRRFGWVAQKPNPFPWSAFENIAYAPRIHGIVHGRRAMRAHVEACLRKAGLWEELKDRLDAPGTELSGGQQQRLCVARALSVNPEVLLLDEPCGSLDPISTERIERLLNELRRELCVVIITHNMEQAARLAQKTGFFKLGRLLEYGATRELFTAPKSPECRAFLEGEFG